MHLEDTLYAPLLSERIHAKAFPVRLRLLCGVRVQSWPAAAQGFHTMFVDRSFLERSFAHWEIFILKSGLLAS